MFSVKNVLKLNNSEVVSDRRDFILFFNDNFESVKQMFFVSKVSMEGTADANARETCKILQNAC